MSLFRFFFRLLLGRRLPVTSGRLVVRGPQGTVRISRDQYAVPLIEADHQADCAFAVGFCHGQDRGFQLELMHRVARGTVAELIGPAALPVDRLSRRIGFHRSAQEQLALLDDDVRADLEAYAAGVNAGRAASPLPHELTLLGGKSSSWEAVNSLAIGKVLSFKLAANWDAELMRLKVLMTDGPEALRALDPSYAAWHPVIDPPGAAAGEAIDRLAEDVNVFLAWSRSGAGSNNWVLAPSRTRTGRPILANDPHLDAGLPSHFYLVSARGPEGAVAGATLVGGPAVLAGHNGHAAWGLTAGLVDNTDLFLEELGPDAASVRCGGVWQQCVVAEEVIHVKGGKPVTERVLITPRGPIIGPTLIDTPQAISLRATWLDPVKARGLFTAQRARSFAELREEGRHWPVSSQSIAYADATGVIGWQLIGRAPRRRTGHGLVPMPAANPECGWEPDPVPYDQMPHVQSPACGWLATANNRPTAEGRGPYLGADFLDGYRYVAISRALAGRSDWDVASTMKLQTDQHAPAWTDLRDVVLEAIPDAPAELREWDGDLSAHSRAGALFELWLVEMLRRSAKAKAPRSWEWVAGRGLTAITPYNFACYRRTSHLVELMRDKPDGWFERGWRTEMQEAMTEVRAFLDSQGRKGWGELRPLLMHHALGRAGGWMGWFLGAVYNLGPIPFGGDADVINQAAVLPLRPLAPADNIAAMRMVVDVGAWHNSRWVLPAGQSGNPLSPHYGDLFALWQRGEGVPIAFTLDEVRSAAVNVLELVPDGASVEA